MSGEHNFYYTIIFSNLLFLIQFIFGNEASSVYGELVVTLAFVISRVFGHGWVNFHLTFQLVLAQSPFTDLLKK